MKFNIPQTSNEDHLYDGYFQNHIDCEIKEVVSPSQIIASTAARQQQELVQNVHGRDQALDDYLRCNGAV